MKNNYHGNIGSISHGTMRTEDLIPQFIIALEGMRPLRREHRRLIRDIEARAHFGNKTLNDDYLASGDAESDLDDLFSALNAYSLPYMYFGAHPGDGSDYGFWLSEMWDEDFCDCGQSDCDSGSIKVNDSADIPKGFTGEAAVVNDHGNVSLYRVSRGRKYPVWSLV